MVAGTITPTRSSQLAITSMAISSPRTYTTKDNEEAATIKIATFREFQKLGRAIQSEVPTMAVARSVAIATAGF
jgi:hypothetical protein